jgi:peptidyl-prolyl isomerase E (cyclophilin E)
MAEAAGLPAGAVLKGPRNKRVVYVGGLAEEADEETLHAAFIPFGDIVEVNIPKDFAKNTHRGFAFVEFEDEDDSKDAIDNMDGAEVRATARASPHRRRAPCASLDAHAPPSREGRARPRACERGDGRRARVARWVARPAPQRRDASRGGGGGSNCRRSRPSHVTTDRPSPPPNRAKRDVPPRDRPTRSPPHARMRADDDSSSAACCAATRRGRCSTSPATSSLSGRPRSGSR